MTSSIPSWARPGVVSVASGLTQRQAEALSFIQCFIATNGYSPSYQEIGDGLGGKSKSDVSRLVHELVDRGVIAKKYGRWRSIGLTAA